MKNTKEMGTENAKTFKLVVIGPDNNFPEKKKVKVGDVVTVKKEESNVGAVNAYFNSSKIGLLGVAPNTLPEGCQPVTEVVNNIDDESQCIVTAIESVTFKGSKAEATVALVIECPEKGYILPAVKEAKYGKKSRKITYTSKVGGPKRGNDAKYAVLAALKAGEKPEVELEILEGNVLVTLKGVKAGNIIPEDEKHSPSEIIEAINNATSYRAFAVSADVTSFNIEVNVVTEVAGKDVLVEDILKSGVLSEPEIDKLLDFISTLSINEKSIAEIFNFINDDRVKTTSRIPTGDMLFKNSDRIMETLIIGINAGSNMNCQGPKASGKNTAIEDVARLYKMPIYEMQINAQTDNETILGSKTIKSREVKDLKSKINNCVKEIVKLFVGVITKTVKFQTVKDIDVFPLVEAFKGREAEIQFEPSALVRAMEEGGIIVLDEINTGHPEVLALLNPVLDMRKRLDVPGYGLVQAHPRFRVFATMNKDYQGTFEMNEATASRFSTVVFEKPKSIQDIIKSNCPGAEENTLKICDKIYKSMAKLVDDAKASGDIINIRAFIDACTQVEWGQPIKDALIRNVAHSCSDMEDRQAIEQIIDLNLG